MGWDSINGYERHVMQRENSNKITRRQKAFNTLSNEEIERTIKIVVDQMNKDMKEQSKIHLEDGNVDIPYIRTTEEPIEYVVEGTKDEDELDR